MDPKKNFAKATLSTGYDSNATIITLASGDGSKISNPDTEGPFDCVWFNSTDYKDPSDDPNVEIIRVISKSTDTLQIQRAKQGTTAKNHNLSGKIFKLYQSITAKDWTDFSETPINEWWQVNDIYKKYDSSTIYHSGKHLHFVSGRPFRWDQEVGSQNPAERYWFYGIIKDVYNKDAHSGTVAQNSGNNTIYLGSSASSTNDHYNGMIIKVTFSGASQIRKIIDYTGSTRMITIDSNWTTNPTTSYS